MSAELVHYGILGMKWGVRRTPEQLGHRTSPKRKTKVMSADQKRKAAMKKDVKRRHTLSDVDLRKKIERIKMEKQLRELTAEEIAPGKKFVAEVLSASGKKVATSLVTGATLYGVKSAFTKSFSIKELGSYMTPKPKK